ncbi:PLDc_N domain-containing protein [Salinibacterium sp. NSLL150]|uniref:PLD nuclease N-terminal domain-containing protein n=1 Tax=unclassified Salinibacterium TaxID=2632331 RepID=UPI0018CD91E8|nr:MULTISPECIES: PLD nuclease N-terminal domain-containing protein [unclassified Salinibacterium]MBH0025042.1 PLDc_N domain-containing protein [Salinibacterium sp. SWN248]MBH0099939.1 PLDc_N domain-containing protein [Salinibacterium sp. NSLL35]MBH0102693.1 PLDc_N domain-containing protein [Salinibacterium sp. NSLL150]MBH0105453.1 PLDc_N domain-containing protein [Salinibacterium sp. NSLL16]MBH0108213.1 PLDc_N domain-containing protein [Salinibacterium sp. NSLL17]
MPRLLVVLAFAIVAVDVFSIVDVILTERSRVRAMPKVLWIIVILLLPVIGVVLWFMLGKARSANSGQTRTVAPDDDPDFLRKMRRQEEQDERIRRLEQELADLDDDDKTN